MTVRASITAKDANGDVQCWSAGDRVFKLGPGRVWVERRIVGCFTTFLGVSLRTLTQDATIYGVILNDRTWTDARNLLKVITLDDDEEK